MNKKRLYYTKIFIIGIIIYTIITLILLFYISENYNITTKNYKVIPINNIIQSELYFIANANSLGDQVYIEQIKVIDKNSRLVIYNFNGKQDKKIVKTIKRNNKFILSY